MFSECFRRLLDRKISQGVVVACLSSPIAHINDWSRQNGGVYNHRLSVNDHTPVLESFLTEQIVREVLNGLELLLRVLSA